MKISIIACILIIAAGAYSQVSQQWAARFNGSANLGDYANAVIADNSGNVYITGKSVMSGNYTQIATVKYNSSGTLHWIKTFNLYTTALDEATSIGMDGLNNVYIAGGAGGLWRNYCAIRYNPAGVQQWVFSYDGPDYQDDFANGMYVDPFGQVYVTGLSHSSTHFDYATIKINPIGTQNWVKRYDGSNHDNDVANAIPQMPMQMFM